jgi:nitrogen regulatory protein P-II 1
MEPVPTQPSAISQPGSPRSGIEVVERLGGGVMVELVTAVIKPHKLEEVKDALRALGVLGITITEVKGFGRQGGHTETYRGSEYTIDFLPKLKLEVLCTPEDTDKIVDTIVDSAQTGKIGDGKIWVSSINRVVRVRTGERDTEAL